MSITRTAIVDDNGSGMTGTVIDNAWKQEFYDQIDAADAALSTSLSTGSSSVSTTGNITSLTLPSGTGPLVIYMNNASLATIQGIAAGLSGQHLTIFSIGAGQVDLSHQDAAAAAGTKLLNYATSGKTSLAAGIGAARLVYDSSARWRLLEHEQGAWITSAYNGSNFVGNASMTWTVDSGDFSAGMMQYWLKGRTLHIMFVLQTTTIGGTPSTNLQILNGAYGNFTWAKTLVGNALVADNGNGFVLATSQSVWQITASDTKFFLFKQGGGNFTAGTNNCQVSGEFFGEVT